MAIAAPAERRVAAAPVRGIRGIARPRSFPELIAVKTGAEYVVIRLDSVSWIQARGNYSLLYADRRPRLLGTSLAALTRSVLDPDVFLRIHRSVIVNAREIMSVRIRRNGDLTLILRDGTRVPCSRRYRRRLDEQICFLA